jgi:transcriptional regulator with GAF, ATPase, and Fis domain
MRPLPVTKAPAGVSVITQSEGMLSILDRVNTIAASDSTVLLIGETGVGKELFADYIHRASPRCERPFIKIALSAMPHDLLESELFGHERGAFTHAISDKKGLFELAHGGTLFLDDIDDVPQAIQPKLLRVLESQEVLRVGGTGTIRIDVRLIAASKVDLKGLVERNLFRADLFYRVNVFPVSIPPLRDRPEDIRPLFGHFLQHFAPAKSLSVSTDAMRALVSYSWPGNVRELRNIAQRIALFASSDIRISDLPPEICAGQPFDMVVKACTRCLVEESVPFHQVVSCLEINMLRHAWAQAGGNRTQMARMLGMSLSTLRDKLKKYGLSPDSE